MRNRIRPSLFALLIVAGIAGAAGAQPADFAPLDDQEILRRVEAAPAAEARPDLDALVLFDGLFISFRDGLPVVRRQQLTRLYTEWSMDQLGDPRLAYDRGRQELNVHTSRTFVLDGGTIDTPDNGYNNVTPDGVARSTHHLDHREMVVTHVGLEPGVTVFLDWTVRDVEEDWTPFDLVVFPHGRFPTVERVVVAQGVRGELVVPEHALHAVSDLQANGDGFVWRGTDLPAAPHPRGARAGDELPWIALARAGDWESMLVQVERHISVAAESRDETFGVAMADLEEDAPFLTDRDAVRRWVERVGERTALVDHGSWHHLGRPRAATQLLAGSFATSLERCALMLAGCHELGLVRTNVVFPARWAATANSVVALQSLHAPVLRVVDGRGDTLWVDPAEASVSPLPPGPQGLKQLRVKVPKAYEETVPIRESVINLDIYWDLASGSATCEGRLTGVGAAELDLEKPETLIRDWMAGWTDSTEVEEVRIAESGPDGLVFSVSGKATLPEKDDRGRIAVDLPRPPLDVDRLLPSVADQAYGSAEHVLFADAASSTWMSVKWRLRLPEDRKLLAPGPRINKSQGMSFEVRRSLEGRTAEIDVILTWDGQPVKPDGYSAFRQLLIEALDTRNTRVVLGG